MAIRVEGPSMARASVISPTLVRVLSMSPEYLSRRFATIALPVPMARTVRAVPSDASLSCGEATTHLVGSTDLFSLFVLIGAQVSTVKIGQRIVVSPTDV